MRSNTKGKKIQRSSRITTSQARRNIYFARSYLIFVRIKKGGQQCISTKIKLYNYIPYFDLFITKLILYVLDINLILNPICDA